MSAPLCRDCHGPVLVSSWTATNWAGRKGDEVCMSCRRKRGIAASQRTRANRAALEPKKAKR